MYAASEAGKSSESKSITPIDTCKQFIGQLVEDKTIFLKQQATDKMVADAITNCLPDPSFERHKTKMLGKSSYTCSVRVSHNRLESY